MSITTREEFWDECFRDHYLSEFMQVMTSRLLENPSVEVLVDWRLQQESIFKTVKGIVVNLMEKDGEILNLSGESEVPELKPAWLSPVFKSNPNDPLFASWSDTKSHFSNFPLAFGPSGVNISPNYSQPDLLHPYNHFLDEPALKRGEVLTTLMVNNVKRLCMYVSLREFTNKICQKKLSSVKSSYSRV